MSENKKVIFKCQECGSNHLAYQKYVKCITPVLLQDNSNIEYLPSKIDEDDYLSTCNGFICLDCSEFVEHCGCKMETEKELRAYLQMDPVLRETQQNEYNEMINAQIEAQEQLEKETYFEDEIAKKSA